MKIFKIIIIKYFVFFSVVSFAQLTNRVLVIKNTNSPASVTVANDYMLRRGVTKVVNVNCQNSQSSEILETISYLNYLSQIQNPIVNYLSTHPEIDFIVLTKGIPLRINNVPGKTYGGICALDSYLAALGYMTSATTSTVNISDINYGANFVGDAYVNKFWLSTTPFSHTVYGGYLVTRLDGYTVADAIALTTRSLQAETNLAAAIPLTGKILLDADPTFGFPNLANQPFTIIPAGYIAGQTLIITAESSYGDCNSDMVKTNNELTVNSIPVQYDNTNAYIGNVAGLQGYYGWGSNDNFFNQSAYNSLTFAPGAIAETIVSTSARSFLHTIGGQSKIADFITQGVTGIKGYCDEPLIQGVASPSILFNRYTKGWTLAESFYAASRLVSWMDIVIGDPICRAYKNPLVTSINNITNDVNLYLTPNPSAEFIKIRFKGIKKQLVIIYDILGNKIKKVNVYSNESIPTIDLIKGFYFIKMPSYFNQTIKFEKL